MATPRITEVATERELAELLLSTVDTAVMLAQLVQIAQKPLSEEGDRPLPVIDPVWLGRILDRASECRPQLIQIARRPVESDIQIVRRPIGPDNNKQPLRAPPRSRKFDPLTKRPRKKAAPLKCRLAGNVIPKERLVDEPAAGQLLLPGRRNLLNDGLQRQPLQVIQID